MLATSVHQRTQNVVRKASVYVQMTSMIWKRIKRHAKVIFLTADRTYMGDHDSKHLMDFLC